MENKAALELKLIKKGTEDSQEPWIEMKTVNDIFKQACNLNEKDRKKMLREFSDMMETCVSCNELAKSVSGNELSGLDMPSFKWRND